MLCVVCSVMCVVCCFNVCRVLCAMLSEFILFYSILCLRSLYKSEFVLIWVCLSIFLFFACFIISISLHLYICSVCIHLCFWLSLIWFFLSFLLLHYTFLSLIDWIIYYFSSELFVCVAVTEWYLWSLRV